MPGRTYLEWLESDGMKEQQREREGKDRQQAGTEGQSAAEEQRTEEVQHEEEEEQAEEQHQRAPTWYLMCITAKTFATSRATKTCVTVPGWIKAMRLDNHSFLELGLGSLEC